MKTDTVDLYIADQDEAVRPLLEEIRGIIREAAPDSSEMIAWGIPTYRQNDQNVIHFGAARHHVGIYPGSEAVAVFQSRLEGIKVSKGTIRLPLDRPVDRQLLTELTTWCVERAAAHAHSGTI